MCATGLMFITKIISVFQQLQLFRMFTIVCDAHNITLFTHIDVYNMKAMRIQLLTTCLNWGEDNVFSLFDVNA